MRWSCRAPRSTCACASTPRAPWRSPTSSPTPTPARLQATLDAQRRDSHALEISLFGPHGRILGASLENAFENLPAQPPPDLLRQMEQRMPYVSLEPQSGGRYVIRTAAVLPRSQRARRALRGGDLPGARAAGRAVRGGAGDLQPVRQPGGDPRAAEGELPRDAHPGACCWRCWRRSTARSTPRSAWCARCRT